MTDETIEVRENENSDVGFTKTHDFRVREKIYDEDGGRMVGVEEYEVTIEYKPGKVILDEDSLNEYVTKGLATEEPEQFIVDLYRQIVEDAYPGHRTYEEPWEYVPLVITIEYGQDSRRTSSTLHLGQYR